MKTFALPDLGEGLQEAEIVSWHVGVGDRVIADQPIVSVETAKAVVEVPSPWSGKIVALHAKTGDVVQIGGALVDIDLEGAAQDSGTVVGTLPRSAPVASIVRPVEPPMAGARARVSPAVRKLAHELGVDLSAIAGTGPGGSITREDVEGKAGAGAARSAFVPLRGVRRAMAEVMKSASAVVPATVSDEAVIEAWPAGTDPTLRLIRAVVAGCRASPALNAWLDAPRNSRLLHERIDLGIAMETEDGLFAPVLRDAGTRSDADVRSGLDTIKRDVEARTVPVGELRGQTISLSNFGMLGGLTAALTIVPPQVAILGAGRIHTAVRAVEGEIRTVRVLPLSLTFDHRAVTGAEAIRFLNAAITALGEA
jgi:2-oxoisovalerate dehydrogenase E2 component (dihydrolipoyl transacylase)